MSNSFADVHDRIREARAKAAARKLIDDDKIELFYLEFSDPDKEGDDAFLGVAIIPAERGNFLEAVRVAYHFSCNPGGEVRWIEKSHLERLPRRLLAKLLTAEEVLEAETIIAGGMQ